MPSLISVADLNRAELDSLVTAASNWFAVQSRVGQLLAGRVVGLYFGQPSTRTRTAFSSASLRLGASIITYGPNDLQLSTGETDEDTGNVLAPMLDCLVVRASGDHARLMRLSAHGRLPVVNAMNTIEHPTQAIGDLATMRAYRGDLAGVQVLYAGEANSTTLALAHALMRVPGSLLVVAAPLGYGFDAATIEAVNAQAAPVGARCVQVAAIDDVAVAGLEHPDFVYTTQWQTTGTSKPDPEWRAAFYPGFQVNEELLARWPRARVLHDLPARRGEEISAEVLDGPRSLALEQARNKLAGAAASLAWVLAGPAGLTALTG